MRHSIVSGYILRRCISSSAYPCFAPPNASSAEVPLGQRRQTGGQQRKGKSLLWWTAVSLGAGTALGVAAGYDKIRKSKTVVANTDDDAQLILSSVPTHKPSRSVVFPMDASGLKLTLFQYQTCPFCCKVRAMLDFFGVSYDIVEVNPVLRSQIKWSQTYKKVPILVVQTPQGEVLQLNDSSMIVSALYSFLYSNKHNGSSSSADSTSSLHNIAKCYPSVKYNDDDGRQQSEILNRYFLMLGESNTGKEEMSKEEILEERKWRRWADSVFVHTLSPNIYRTIPEAIESFKNFDRVGEWDKNFSTWERYLVIYVGALAMWIIGKRLQKRHNLKEDVRQSLFEESDYWIRNIHQKGGNFMGGVTPNLSDLAVYGVLNSIEGCKAFDDLMRNSEPLKRWYKNIQISLKENTMRGPLAVA